MTPEQRFQEAKAESAATRQISLQVKTHFTLWKHSQALKAEAAAFRDMVQDNGYVHTIPLDDLKFSWEE
jgi:hypothetical protein